MKKYISVILLAALMVALLSLSGCGKKPQAPETKVVKIENLADLPAAIDSNLIIEIPEGLQNLGEAFGYDYAGKTLFDHASLEYCGDGYSLTIEKVSNLTIRGAGAAKTEFVIEDPYADVIRFKDCDGIKLEKMTLGHFVEPGHCVGAVVEVDHCKNVDLSDLDLYGCGTYGVEAIDSEDVTLKNSIIRECSYGIVYATGSKLSVADCNLNDCDGYTAVEAYRSTVDFKNCKFDNNIMSSGFASTDASKVNFDGCTFSVSESFDIKYGIEAHNNISFNNCKFDDSIKLENNIVYVSNAKELFEAVSPNTTIIVRNGWCEVSDWLEKTYLTYGEEWNYNHQYVNIDKVFDGYMATIIGVNDFAIVGASYSKYASSIIATPRYAEVLSFDRCNNIRLMNLSLGHTNAGDCSGDVVSIFDSNNVFIDNCDLFGCGVNGLYTNGVENLTVSNTHIRDCSDRAFVIRETTGKLTFSNCAFYRNSFGLDYYGRDTLVMDKCSFGHAESAYVGMLDNVELIDCTLEDVTFDYDDEFDYYDDGSQFNEFLGTLSIVPFDKEVLADTAWIPFYLMTETTSEYLGTDAKLEFNKDGSSCEFNNYFFDDVKLNLVYDSTGYAADGFEGSNIEPSATISILANTEIDESELTMIFSIGDSIFYLYKN